MGPNRSALVTGAAGGIGKAIAERLVADGFGVSQLTMDVNVKGVLHCYQSAARQMITQGRGGRLIGAASVAAHRGGKWQSAYSASKFAGRGMSQCGFVNKRAGQTGGK